MTDCPACIYAANEAIMERRMVERYGDNVRLEPRRAAPMAHTCRGDDSKIHLPPLTAEQVERLIDEHNALRDNPATLRRMLDILADEIVTYRRRMGDVNCERSEVLTEACHIVTAPPNPKAAPRCRHHPRDHRLAVNGGRRVAP